MATATAAADRPADSGGFFKPFKPGQGFWTRLGTALGAGLIIIFTIQYLYRNIPSWTSFTNEYDQDNPISADQLAALREDPKIAAISGEQLLADGQFAATVVGSHLQAGSLPLYLLLAGIAAVMGLLGWWLINRPKHADFLINTDGEMKKVTWPTRPELIGSTKVVIAFMFFMAAMLFFYDLIFGTIMYWIDVLKVRPPTFDLFS
jgi:preprotein translocase SecE subunit